MSIYQFMKKSILLVALAQAVALIAISSAMAQTPTGPVPPTFFGMHIMQPSDWPTVLFDTLGKGTGVAWPFVERSRGNFNWAPLDAYVNAASSHGVSITYSTQYVPPWAAADQSSCRLGFYGAYVCTSGVANIQNWENFVTALVTRYKGRIQIYELWNEPQTNFTGTMAQLVALTQAEYNIIRSIDPAATILSPSMVAYGYPYLDSYFAAGGTKDIDVVAMHAYPNPDNDVAEFLMGSVTTGLKAVLSKYGLSSKPIWDTENSWGGVSAGAITNSDLRAAFIARDYLLHWSQGITRVYWYAWDNSDYGTLWSPTSGIDEAGLAYEQVYSWMNGATMAQSCSLNGSTSFYHAVYTCDLKLSNGSQARAVWNTEGSSTYTAPSQFTHYRDLAGNTHSVPSGGAVTIGLKPILLTFGVAPPTNHKPTAH
jgi:hypothetical protein